MSRNIPRVSDAEAKAARLSPRLIRALRTRLGLSQTKFARLIGVSEVSVVQWEGGRAWPSGKNRAAAVALRRLGRREAQRILAAMPQSEAHQVRRKKRLQKPGRKRSARPRKAVQTRRRR